MLNDEKKDALAREIANDLHRTMTDHLERLTSRELSYKDAVEIIERGKSIGNAKWRYERLKVG